MPSLPSAFRPRIATSASFGGGAIPPLAGNASFGFITSGGIALSTILGLSPFSMWEPEKASSILTDTGPSEHVATLGEPVDTFSDVSGNGWHFVQNGLALRPTLAIDSNGARYLNFAGNQIMQVASSQAAFSFLHSGAGMTVVSAWMITNDLHLGGFFSTATLNTFNRGFILHYDDDSRTDALVGVAYDASGTAVASYARNNSCTEDGLLILITRYNDATTLFNTTGYDSGSYTIADPSLNTPSAAGSSYDLTLGGLGNGLDDIYARCYGLIMFDRLLATDDETLVRDYYAQKIYKTL